MLSPGVRVEDGADVEGGVLMHGVHIGAGARIRNAILDKNTVVGPGVRVGYSEEEDRSRGLTVSAGGVVVGGKGGRIL